MNNCRTHSTSPSSRNRPNTVWQLPFGSLATLEREMNEDSGRVSQENSTLFSVNGSSDEDVEVVQEFQIIKPNEKGTGIKK